MPAASSAEPIFTFSLLQKSATLRRSSFLRQKPNLDIAPRLESEMFSRMDLQRTSASRFLSSGARKSPAFAASVERRMCTGFPPSLMLPFLSLSSP